MEKLIAKIRACQNMQELDGMRLELVVAGKENPDSFTTLQDAFVRRKNQLKRGGSTSDS